MRSTRGLEICGHPQRRAIGSPWQPALIAAAVSTGAPGKAGAEVAELRIAQQYGIGYLPLHVIKHENLLAKHAKAAGLGDIPVRWAVLGGGSAMNDALLSDSVDLVSGGIGGIGALVTIWAKTKDSLDVRGVAALDSLPIALLTSNPAVKTVKDFTDQDRIALPSVKVSIQAVTLQMAAGFVVHLFPTGQGNVIGNPIEPMIKLTGNPRTALTMSEHIDLDVSGLLRREMTLGEAGDALIELTLRPCNGRLTAAEALGHREFVLTKLYRSV